MKKIVIENVPKGANVLIANDTGKSSVSKDDTIKLYKTMEEGELEFAYDDDEKIIIRVRCASEDRGYWRPVEIKTRQLEPGTTNVHTMVEDTFLNPKPKKTRYKLW